MSKSDGTLEQSKFKIRKHVSTPFLRNVRMGDRQPMSKRVLCF